ncbi:hypothetical protein BsWGS_27210 [Bradybaena similaris]
MMYKYAVFIICAVLVAANICSVMSDKEQRTGLESSRAAELLPLSLRSSERIKRADEMPLNLRRLRSADDEFAKFIAGWSTKVSEK